MSDNGHSDKPLKNGHANGSSNGNGNGNGYHHDDSALQMKQNRSEDDERLAAEWQRREAALREQLGQSGVSAADLDKFVEIRRKFFFAASNPDPVFAESLRMLDEAIKAVPPAQRLRFIERRVRNFT